MTWETHLTSLFLHIKDDLELENKFIARWFISQVPEPKKGGDKWMGNVAGPVFQNEPARHENSY